MNKLMRHVKNTAITLVFPLTDADGQPVTGCAALDTEKSQDGGAFSDCTNEMAEIGTTGFYAVTITDAELNYGTIVLTFGTSTSGITPLSYEIHTFDPIADQVWDEVLTGAAHNVATSAGRRLRGIQEFQGYEDAAIWIDTLNGTAGTTDFENGTVENPVNSIADANTLAASLNIYRFHVQPGSSITFAAAQTNQEFIGEGWTLALGGQDISGTSIRGATVSGIAAGTGTTQTFLDCHLNAMSVIKGTHLIGCDLENTITVVEAGDYFVVRCQSGIAGTATPTWDFGGAIGNTNVNFRDYSGGITLEAMGDTGTDTMSLEGRGQLIEGTCTGGVVAIRGLFTVSGISNLTLSDDARIDVAQIKAEANAVLTDVNTELAAIPTTTSGLRAMTQFLFQYFRNARTETAGVESLKKEDGSTQLGARTLADDGTTFTRGEMG